MLRGAAIIGVSAIVAAGLFGHQSLRRLESAQRWVGHSHTALRAIERLRGHLNSVRSEQRGIVLATAAEVFVARHDSLIRESVSGLAEVQRLTRDNPVQQRRLDSLHLALDSLAASAKRIAALRLTSNDPASILAEEAHIEAQFDQIAEVVARLEREEESLLAARSAVADAATHWARAVVIVSVVFAVLIAAAALSPLYRALQRSRRAQAALESSESRYRQLMEGAADAILIVARGRCVEANARAERLFGYSRTELCSLPIDRIVHTTGANPVDARHLVAGEYVVVAHDGERRAVDVTVAALDDETSQLIMRDITERKEVERLKDEFISVVSHELRTPLTALHGSVRLLRANGARLSAAQHERLLFLAESNVDRLVRLVNDILDFERLSSGVALLEPTETDLGALGNDVLESIRPIAEQSNVTLVMNAQTVVTLVDRARISQVLTNLVGNAIKFSPSGGRVWVEVDASETEALIRVRDEGRGIPSDQLESVFERFHQVDKSDTRQRGGTGLGLAISRQIVLQHQGRIWVESTVGEGSTFYVALPIRSPAVVAA